MVSQALSEEGEYVPRVKAANIDLEKIASDHPDHWLGAIEREGNWQRGTLYGDDIEHDDVVGAEYLKSFKNQIGYTTFYFGSPRKVRVTRKGSVTVLADFSEKMDTFAQFIIDEIAPYLSSSD